MPRLWGETGAREMERQEMMGLEERKERDLRMMAMISRIKAMQKVIENRRVVKDPSFFSEMMEK